MEPLSFFGRFVRKVLVSCFSDSFCQFLSRQKRASAEGSLRTGGKMAAIMLQTIPSLYTKLSEKNHFISANTYGKYIVCKDYCIAHHDDKTCFLPSCNYHILLFGNVEELLKTLDTFFFTYRHVDFLYTPFKYQFNGKVIAKSEQVFDNVQRAVDCNQRNKGVDRMPSIAKKRLLRRKSKQHLFSSFQKTKTTLTSGSVFVERTEKVKKTKFELELIKLIKVSYKIKSL